MKGNYEDGFHSHYNGGGSVQQGKNLAEALTGQPLASPEPDPPAAESVSSGAGSAKTGKKEKAADKSAKKGGKGSKAKAETPPEDPSAPPAGDGEPSQTGDEQ